MPEQLLLFVIALASNTLSAMAGGGAGLLQLPALIFLGLPFATALATHKVATVALGLGATISHLRAGALNPRLSVWLLLWGVPGVVLGANVIVAIDPTLAKIALGLLTIGLGIYSWRRPQLGLAATSALPEGWRWWIGGAMLAFLGVLNGSLTSGTGLMVTLWLVRWFGMDYKQAVAHTLVLVGLVWNGTGAISLGLLTPPAWTWLPALLLGSVVGGYVGAVLARRGRNQLIKRLFEVVTVLTGIALLADAWLG